MSLFPRRGTQVDQILRAIHKNGPMSAADAKAMDRTIGRSTFHTAVANYGLIPLPDHKYDLPKHLTKFFEDDEARKVPHQGELVAPCRINVFNKPMQGYDAMMRAGRRGGVRDISVKSCSVSLKPWSVFQ